MISPEGATPSIIPGSGKSIGDMQRRKVVKIKIPTILIKELSRHARKRLLRNFLALDSGDRLLRFGSVLPDELVKRYVENLDFSLDTIFGVYD